MTGHSPVGPGEPGEERRAAARRALPSHFREKSPLTDTAGTPWAGRDYAPSPFPEDHGDTPEPLAAALRLHAAGEDPHRRGLVAALAGSRLLVPIMAVATEKGTTAHGLTGDNGADMAMVSITLADGTRILPVFSSVAALAAWRTDARPVPVLAPQAAQAAVQEGCTALLLNPGTDGPPARDTESDRGAGLFLPRSVLWALAQGREWIPPHEDPAVASALTAIAAVTDQVRSLTARPGAEREVDLHLQLVEGLGPEQVRRVVDEVTQRLGADIVVADRISSVRLVLTS